MPTHPDSKVPVMVQPGNMRAMMVGDAGHQAVLTYAQQPGELKPGQRVITAGIGDGIPYGLVLGTIAEPNLRQLMASCGYNWPAVATAAMTVAAGALWQQAAVFQP
jgi:cell shape-determining protein MreC